MPDCGALYLRELTSGIHLLDSLANYLPMILARKKDLREECQEDNSYNKALRMWVGEAPASSKGSAVALRRQGMLVRDDTIEGNFLESWVTTQAC